MGLGPPSPARYANWGSQVWDTINGPNLRQNIAPTRDRATAILVKGANHAVEAIRIRKV